MHILFDQLVSIALITTKSKNSIKTKYIALIVTFRQICDHLQMYLKSNNIRTKQFRLRILQKERNTEETLRPASKVYEQLFWGVVAYRPPTVANLYL